MACTTKLKSTKEQRCWQQAPGNKDLDAGPNQPKVELLASSALARKVETANLDFCDSDWEII